MTTRYKNVAFIRQVPIPKVNFQFHTHIHKDKL